MHNINRTKLSLFTKPEAITYIGWLKSDITGLKSTSIKMEFDTPELANETIRKGLNWDGQPHSVERYVAHSKIMQCFNCQSYGHIGNRCLSTITCAKCASHHDTKSCTADSRRCAACHGAHPSRSNNCKARMQEKERMKKATREAPTYWPLKVVPEELLETRDENSQNPRCISPVAANNSNPDLSLPSKKSQKGKKKTHKLHHPSDCLQPTQPAHTPQPVPPSINLEQRLMEMENATRITEMKYTLAYSLFIM